jgi:ABC-type nickel/cobalt efflux system permease component RcnA
MMEAKNLARLCCLSIATVLLVTTLTSRSAAAHPMGNFSINHYSAINVEPLKIQVLYIIDMAEIPTFQELHSNSISPRPNDRATQQYVARTAKTFRNGLSLAIDGVRVALREVSHDVIFPPGAGGLLTMKIAVSLEGQTGKVGVDVGRHLEFHDANFPDRAGWKEIIATASSGAHIVSSSVPQKDRSNRLSDYTTNLLNSPPQILSATIEVSQAPLAQTSSSAAVPATANEPVLHANQQGTPKSAFTELIATREMSLGFVLTAILISAALGTFHALEPGHGKTVVAAYLVGSRGTARHAAMLGLLVTASHTGGVYLLGLVTLYASRYVVPEHLYPWFGAASGLIIAGLGMVLFVRRIEGADSHSHDHGGHSHTHGILGHTHSDGHRHVNDHSHDHAPSGTSHRRPISCRELLALGITGGIIPCPAALVVLLGAMAVGRVGFGLLLIVAFSVGLAAALICTGLVVVFARRFMDRYHYDGPIITRWLPLASSGVITAVGIVITLRSLVTTGLF